MPGNQILGVCRVGPRGGAPVCFLPAARRQVPARILMAMLSFTREAAWLASWEHHPGLGTRERRSRALRRTGRRHGMEFRSPSGAGAFHDGSLGGRVSRNRVYSMAIRFRTLVIMFAVALPGPE